VLENTGAYAEAEDADEPSPGDALSALFGFDRAAADAPTGSAPWLSEPVDLAALGNQLQRAFDPQTVTTAIQEASDSDLARVRGLARLLASGLPLLARAANQFYETDDYAGLGYYALQRSRRDELRWRLGHVVAVLLLWQLQPDASLDELSDAI